MSARIVLLGPRPTENGQVQNECPMLQVSPSDASALIQQGRVFASMTLWGGELSDATILLPVEALQAPTERTLDDKWNDLVTFLQQVAHPRYEVEMIPTPIPTVAP